MVKLIHWNFIVTLHGITKAYTRVGDAANGCALHMQRGCEGH